MADNGIYKDIAKRTGGNIYVGVVGPVRSGKSTFIHKFLESVVIPNIENEYDKTRTVDEAPQSASGRTVMTTEPKFIPDEAVKISLGEDISFNVRLIDCVGYMVDGALGASADGEVRMVRTPWSEEEMPFETAAEIGTEKVIKQHSTIAVLVTTDGSICDIPRDGYIDAEERIVSELRSVSRPFAIVLNSAHPDSPESRMLAMELEEKYGAPVALVDLTAVNEDDMCEILSLVLHTFPIKRLTFRLPEWTDVLPTDHRIHTEARERVEAIAASCEVLGDVDKTLSEYEEITKTSLSAGDGTAEFRFDLSKEEYYKVISELAGYDIESEKELFSALRRLGEANREFVRIEDALRDVNEKGYGIVMPRPDELSLEEPRLMKQGAGWGVKVSANAQAIHMIKTGIRTELCPVVGTEEQTEEVVKYLLDEFEEDPRRVWESNMFGKSLYDLVSDGMNSKLINLPEDAREKLGETLEKVVNEGANGLICILL